MRVVGVCQHRDRPPTIHESSQAITGRVCMILPASKASLFLFPAAVLGGLGEAGRGVVAFGVSTLGFTCCFEEHAMQARSGQWAENRIS